MKIKGIEIHNTFAEAFNMKAARIIVTADNNNDWGLTIDKNRSSASEYALQIKVASNATYLG